MKTWGWICVVVGSLAFLGAVLKGNNPTGPVFWLGLGVFLLYRANQKKQEQKEKLNLRRLKLKVKQKLLK
jgi:hypothetical protein